jgi:hypothetical protein
MWQYVIQVHALLSQKEDYYIALYSYTTDAATSYLLLE